MRKLKQIFILIAFSLFCISCSTVPSTSYNPWSVIQLETESTFADLAFTDDPNHGWLVGSQAALFETTDGGKTWQEKKLDLGEEKASFTAVSFNGQEGWITGKPSILLHTEDGGQSWSRIPLSEKLPGAPNGIVALGSKMAEMVTDLGAIYKTSNGGRTWQALVEGAVGVARTIARSADGKYVAVSARGNFYSTWEPGQTEWTPHNRTSSRRLQTMGYSEDGRLWLLARGGQIQFASTDGQDEEWGEVIYPEPSTSWGLLDLAYRTPEEIWVSGGSGNVLVSFDNGKTWQKDREIEDTPSNLYKIVFVTPEKGFILGQKGVLLRYEPPAETA
ncbi:putative photosystem II stability/assembly factor-like protein [Pleurocapsa sp. PCC 7327]|uniref:photosynthesis system II assembly factor Ycf48 n=1 Tax=Pleurocapsa sp. PCC 7327 TaxID=118163 RepID=UPI00029FDA08|nr:photosynthesis system II assembly factor Ycf48 [Pleurocapsa sp. PCC 7327]AFY76347.1 putative photosystem II stability/assembly factor-like protein [Pleurocapsa sp. PCC 7327]